MRSRLVYCPQPPSREHHQGGQLHKSAELDLSACQDRVDLLNGSDISLDAKTYGQGPAFQKVDDVVRHAELLHGVGDLPLLLLDAGEDGEVDYPV